MDLANTVFLLALAAVGTAKLCPIVNHTVCNPGTLRHHACVCALTRQEAPPPEKSCNYLLEIQDDIFPAVSVEFELGDHVDHLDSFPEKKFRSLVSRKLRIAPERLIVLRNRCIEDNEKFVLQFAVLKKNVEIERKPKLQKRQTSDKENQDRKNDDINEDDDDGKKDNTKIITEKTDREDEDDELKQNATDATDRSGDGDEYDNAKNTLEVVDDENDDDEPNDNKVNYSDEKDNKVDDDDDEDDGGKRENNKEQSRKEDDNDKEDGDESDDFDEKGQRLKPYKRADFEDPATIAKNLRADDIFESFEDMKMEIKDVDQLYNIEAIQTNGLLIFQAAFIGALFAFICILGCWRAIATRDENRYESVEEKV